MRVFISTGEVSGDKNAAYLVNKIKVFDWRFYALGGEHLRKEGVEIVENPESISVVGFQEAITRLSEINRVKRKVLKYALSSDLIIGVDFPGFNLPLLKYLKQKGKKVVYYISPQVWAWGKWRVKSLRLFDAVLCILPFEEDILRSYGINAFFVGHPAVKDGNGCDGININPPVIGFLPGSRKDEVRRLLPRMIKIAGFIKKLLPDANLLFSVPFDYPFELPDTYYVIGRGRDVIRVSDVVVSASGTATLEVAIEGKPAVVLYMVSELTYWLGRILLKIPYISLPNIILKRRVYPEFVQHIKPANVAEKVLEMYEKREKFHAISEEISELLKGRYDEVSVLREVLRL